MKRSMNRNLKIRILPIAWREDEYAAMLAKTADAYEDRVSADMRDLLRREADDPRAADAVALYCYQIKKWIGAFTAALGGLDTLVFTGGIGANAPAVRARICNGLGVLGIELDAPRNEGNADLISTDAARVKVHVMRTNEELVIARAVGRLLGLELDKLGIT